MIKVWDYDFPIGRVGIAEDGVGICELFFENEQTEPDKGDRAAARLTREKAFWTEEETPLIREAARQLQEYFAGARKVFDLLLSMKGTEFQLEDWKALQAIPYGETCSYEDIARAIGRPKACRAVGMANHCNPVSIVVPCHRVIGKSGKMVGYGGGLSIKEYLLELERKYK